MVNKCLKKFLGPRAFALLVGALIGVLQSCPRSQRLQVTVRTTNENYRVKEQVYLDEHEVDFQKDKVENFLRGKDPQFRFKDAKAPKSDNSKDYLDMSKPHPIDGQRMKEIHQNVEEKLSESRGEDAKRPKDVEEKAKQDKDQNMQSKQRMDADAHPKQGKDGSSKPKQEQDSKAKLRQEESPKQVEKAEDKQDTKPKLDRGINQGGDGGGKQDTNAGGKSHAKIKDNSIQDQRKAVDNNQNDTRGLYEKSDKIVNPHPYKVVIHNPDLCKVKDLFFIVYVHTASDHYKRRAIIRQTWGNIERFPNIRVLFVMGDTSNVPMMQSALQFESDTYGDILQENFEDTYKNLSYKGVAALKWISQHCMNAKYVLKTDDDVFVNMYTIQYHYQQLYSAGYNSKLMVCLVWWKMHALRKGRWAIPMDMYPEGSYPPYCSGMAYMFSIDVAPSLYNVSQYVKFFWVDDVYISGMLPRAAGIKHITMIKAYIQNQVMEDLYTNPEEWYKYAFTHIHNEELFLRTWDKLTEIAKHKTIPNPSIIEPGRLADKYKKWEELTNKEKDPGKDGKKGQRNFGY